MHAAALLVRPAPRWAASLATELSPGAYVAVVGATAADGIEARRAGLSVRDGLLAPATGSCGVIALFRAPMPGTVVEAVTAAGSGGLAIDPCRVRTGGAAARWPTNLALVHTDGCQRSGTRRVDPGGGGTARRRGGVTCAGNVFNVSASAHRVGTPDLGYVDDDGMETVPAWKCEPGCPVTVLDTQSGTLQSGAVAPHHMRNNSKHASRGGYQGGLGDMPLMGYGDAGGASRFYPQFTSEDAMLDWLARLLGGDPLIY